MSVDAMTAALTLVRSLWPQTAAWEPAVWQAWSLALGDLDPEALAVGVKRAAANETWPSIAAIRRAALADLLAPPLAVALHDDPHPLAREVTRLSLEGWPSQSVDERTFTRLYRDMAAEWDRHVLAGEVMHLDGNEGEDARIAAREVDELVSAGEEPAPLLARLSDRALDTLVREHWSFVTGNPHNAVRFTASGERHTEPWVPPAFDAVAAEGRRRDRPWCPRIELIP